MESVIAWTLMSVWLVSFCVFSFGTIYTLRRQKRQPKFNPNLPPVSVIRPLKGKDPGLVTNLSSLAEQDYPEFTVTLCVADPHDEVLQVAEDCLAKYRDKGVELLIGDRLEGINPKVNNMLFAYEFADHDLILISDSNVRPSPDYLRNLASEFTPTTGVLTSSVVGMAGSGLGGFMEEAHLSTFVHRWMNLASAFGITFVLGKSMMFRKSVFERFGGLKALANFIAEDYMSGELVKQMGYQVKLAQQPVTQFVGRLKVRQFWHRHVRWSVLQKHSAPWVFALEPMGFPSVVNLLGALGLQAAFSVPAWLTLLVLPPLWYFQDVALMKRNGLSSSFAIWSLKETLMPFIWLRALLSSTVLWRGSYIKVGKVDFGDRTGQNPNASS